MRQKLAPTPALLPAWSKQRLIETQIDILSYANRTPVTSQSWYYKAGLFCFPLELYLQRQNLDKIQDAQPDRILLVYPELAAACAKTRILDLSQDRVAGIFDAYHLWAKFASGQSYLNLSNHEDLRKTIFDALGITDDAVAHLNNFWIEKTACGDFIIWGNILYFEQEAAKHFPRAQSTNMSSPVLHEKNSDELFHAVVLDIPAERHTDAPALRLNPETRYRDRYWTAQSLLVQGLVQHNPTVLFLSSTRELPALEMVDQVESLWHRGFWNSVDAITSDLARFEVDDIYRRLAGGELIVVFVAPERFRSRSFQRALEYRLTMDGIELDVPDHDIDVLE